MTPTHNPGQLLWTKAVQEERTTRKQAQFRPGIRAVFSFAPRFIVPRIQAAVSAPSVHDLLTVTTTGSGAAEFVGCFPADPDDFKKHAETRARQNTVVANLTFHNQLSPTFIRVLLGSFHVFVAAFDGDDALIPLDSSNAHCYPNASVTMSENLSADVHTTAFNVVSTIPVQSGVIPGTFYIPFTTSIKFQLDGALVSSVRPVASSNPDLPFPKILTCKFGVVSPNGKWVFGQDAGDWCFCLRFQRAQGHTGIHIRDVGSYRPVFSFDSAQVWCIESDRIHVRSVPDGKQVLAIPSENLPIGMLRRWSAQTTVGFLAPVFEHGLVVLKATEDHDGQMQLFQKIIHLGGDDLRIRESFPAQERWRTQALFANRLHTDSRLCCVSPSFSEACGFKVAHGPVNPKRLRQFRSSGTLIESDGTGHVLPFATLFDVSVPVGERAVSEDTFLGCIFRGSVKFVW